VSDKCWGVSTIRHPSPELEIVKNLRQILVTKMTPQMLILPILSPKKYQFLTIGHHFKKNNQIQWTFLKTT